MYKITLQIVYLFVLGKKKNAKNLKKKKSEVEKMTIILIEDVILKYVYGF